MTNRNKRLIPDIVNGYELSECEFGKFTIVIPQSSVNIFRNPSLETAMLDGGGGLALLDCVEYNSTFSSEIDYAYKGFFGIALSYSVPGGSGECGEWMEFTSTDSGMFNFSVYVNPRRAMRIRQTIREYAAPNAVVHSRYHNCNPGWQRLNMTFHSASAIGTMYAGVEFYAEPSDLNVLYLDCFQMENLPFMTTYFDGDYSGFTYNTIEYYWTGKPHQSKSIRLGSTRSGGREISFNELGFYVSGVSGLGMFPFENITTDISTGGSYFHKSVYKAREFNINGYVAGKNVNELRRQKRQLGYVLNPFTSSITQELLLRFYDTNSPSNFVNIPANFSGGLSGNTDNLYMEKMSLEFLQAQPLIQKEQDSLQFATRNVDITLNGIIRRDKNGTYENIGTIKSGQVDHMIFLPDGKLYVCGSFSSINDDVSLGYCARWNTDTREWEALTPNLGGRCRYVWYLSDHMFVGGDFTNVDGIVGNSYFLERNYVGGTSWTNLGTPDGPVYSGTAGWNYCWMCGVFNNVDGVATGTIAQYNFVTDTWTPFGGGEARLFKFMMRSTIEKVVVDLSDIDLFAIEAALVNGTINKYNWDTDTWDTINTADTNFDCCWPDDNGDLLVVGNFRDTTYLPNVRGIAQYRRNGQWYTYGGSLGNGSVSEGAKWVDTDYLGDGRTYACGNFTEADGRPIQGGLVSYVNGHWSSLGVEPDDPSQTPNVIDIAFAPDHALYIAYPYNATGTGRVSVPVSFVNEGTMPSYPDIAVRFIDPVTELPAAGTLYQITSLTDGVSIVFSGYSVAQYETVYIKMKDGKLRVTNNYNDDLSPFVVEGSSLITIYPGVNDIMLSCGEYGEMIINWNIKYSSLNDIAGRISDVIDTSIYI